VLEGGLRRYADSGRHLPAAGLAFSIMNTLITDEAEFRRMLHTECSLAAAAAATAAAASKAGGLMQLLALIVT
jgi:hypothetical protein